MPMAIREGGMGRGAVTAELRGRGADFAFALAMLVLSAVVGWQAAKLPGSRFDPLGPGAFPKLLAGVLGACSLVLLARLALGLRVGEADTALVLGVQGGDDGHRRRPWLAVGVYLATALYVAVLTFSGVGFFWITAAYLAVIGVAMTNRSARRVGVAAGVAVASAGAVTFLFTKVFVVDLP